MGKIRHWKSKTKRERTAAQHNAKPLMQVLERHVEAGAQKVEFFKVRGRNEWEVEALYFEEEE